MPGFIARRLATKGLSLGNASVWLFIISQHLEVTETKDAQGQVFFVSEQNHPEWVSTLIQFLRTLRFSR